MKEQLHTSIQLIGIGGYKGSGKDTLGAHLVDTINSKGDREAFRIGFADAVKEHCVSNYGLDLEICHADDHTKNTTLSTVAWNTMPSEIQEKYYHHRADTTHMTYREVLQVVGTDICRDKEGEDVWLKRFVAKANSLTSDKPISVVVTDVRFNNEATFIMENRGHVVRIISEQKKGDTHVSEQGISFYNYEIEGKGKASLKSSKRDIAELYGWISLHERVRDFVEE